MHAHAQGPGRYGRTFALAIALNVGFVLVEALYGWRANSLALLADAGHNLTDVAALVVAWGGMLAVRLRPDVRHTFGWQRASILASFANALLLLLAMGMLSWEALQRLRSPLAVDGGTVITVALVGVVVNGFTALLFRSGRERDLNIRGAFLHMAADALLSLGVVISALVYLRTGWLWLDSATSLAIAGVIVVTTWSLFRESLHLMLDGVPDAIELGEVDAYLRSLPGVESVHDLHVWATSTAGVALTAHLVIPSGYPGISFLETAARALHDWFDITHPTLQIETTSLDDECSPPVPAP